MKHSVRIALTIYLSVTSTLAQDGPEFFEKNIRPLFARQCLACHSATAGMGGLKLDTRENLLKGGGHGPAVTPGKPAESLLLRAVAQTSDLKMPPSGKLKDSEIALLRQWVEMNVPWGAEKPALTKTTESLPRRRTTHSSPVSARSNKSDNCCCNCRSVTRTLMLRLRKPTVDRPLPW